MQPRFEQFIRERQYLTNVTPATVSWYTYSLRWLPGEPHARGIEDAVVRMRDKGLKATGCNSAIRAINAYLHWCYNSRIKCSPVCTHLRVPQLKEPQLVLPTFKPEDVRKLVAYRPKGFSPTRLHVLILTLMDTGCRIGEALELKWSDVDMDNLLLKLYGKGSKERIVPMSFELRRHLYRWKQQTKCDLVFSSYRGQRLGRRNMLRDVKLLCKRLRITPPARTIHAFRHTFAVNYLRRGEVCSISKRCSAIQR